MVNELVSSIYNLKFDEAERNYRMLETRYPDHPALYLIRGMITYWKDFPIVSASESRNAFENDLRACIEKCDQKYSMDDGEILLTSLCSRGLLLLFYSDNRLSGEVMPLAAGSYRYLRRAFEFRGEYADFLYFTGLYNYYREAYPEAHPIYKTFVFVFPRGDKAVGLHELENASSKAILLKAEASSFLSYIYQNYENNLDKAMLFSRELYERYPGNTQFLIVYIKSLLLKKRYDEAEKLIEANAGDGKNAYMKGCFEILRAILREKKYLDFSLARVLYNSGIKDLEPYGEYGSEFASYAYYGLSRISKSDKDDEQSKAYRRMANSLTDFRKLNFDN